jgi:hypothetical protein
MQFTENLDKFGINTMHTCLECCVFTLFFHNVLDFFLSFFNRLLDLCRMNSAVKNEFFKSNSCNFSSYGIKA